MFNCRWSDYTPTCMQVNQSTCLQITLHASHLTYVMVGSSVMLCHMLSSTRELYGDASVLLVSAIMTDFIVG
jgi:uncharacterized membrane protein